MYYTHGNEDWFGLCVYCANTYVDGVKKYDEGVWGCVFEEDLFHFGDYSYARYQACLLLERFKNKYPDANLKDHVITMFTTHPLSECPEEGIIRQWWASHLDLRPKGTAKGLSIYIEEFYPGPCIN